MKNGKYCIAVMSIGSGVGQSVITSCNLSRLPITTVGLGINPFAFGAYDCDELDYVPIIYSKDYIPTLIEKCKQHGVDLIIPGSDDEALILAENNEKLTNAGFRVIGSNKELIRLTRDKAKMCDELNPIVDIFVKSYNPDEAKSLIEQGKVDFPLIAKPRGGNASKGIEILLTYEDFIRVSQDHIIQELAIPHKEDPYYGTYLSQINKRINPQVSEISIQIVNDKDGNLIGKTATYNKLNNGVPIEILPYENKTIWDSIDKLIPTLRELGHRGPLNIQGRLTDNGLKIFEMNPRFTGITGLRALMGFNEVESCIMNWLGISDTEHLEINYDRFGTRQTTDKSISLSNNAEIEKISKQINHQVIKSTKTILITGATGFLGQALVKRLTEEDYDISTLSRSKDKAKELFSSYKDITYYDHDDFYSGSLDLGRVDILIHCAFARPHKSNEEIASSLHFTSNLFGSAALHQVPVILNISSQSIYGTKQEPKWSENTLIEPESVYASAKYSTELLANNIKYISKHTQVTSLRLSALSGGQSGVVATDVLVKFVNRVLANKPIEIIGGDQQLERLDVRDAADAITHLLRTKPRSWEPIYNLGANNTTSVLDMANTVVRIANSRYDLDIPINIQSKKIDTKFGMDSSKFYSLTNWTPRYSLDDMIISIFEYLK